MLSLPAGFLTFTNRDLPQVGTLWDAGAYTIAAKALAEGNGYRILNLPGEPWQTKFPPLYPLWLSLGWRLGPQFPSNLPWLALLNFLIFPPFLLLFRAVLLELRLTEVQAWFGCALAAVTHVVLILASTPMSELLCCCFLFASLLLLGGLSRNSRSSLLAFLAGLLGGAAYLTRTAALSLLFAGAVFLLLRRQRGQAALFTAGMLPAIAGWNAWVALHLERPPDFVWAYYTSYADVFKMGISPATLPLLLARNCLNLAASLVTIIVSLPLSGLWNFVPAILGLPLLAAVIARARTRGITQYDLFGLFYCATLMVWPYESSPRLLIPILPVLLASVLATSNYLPIAPLRAGLVFLALWGYYQVSTVANGLRQAKSERAEEAKVYNWIRGALPQDARLVAVNDTALYLFARRQAVTYEMPVRMFYTGDTAAQQAWIRALPEFASRHGVQYVLSTPNRSLTVVDSPTLAYEQSFLNTLESVYARNGTSIRRFY